MIAALTLALAVWMAILIGTLYVEARRRIAVEQRLHEIGAEHAELTMLRDIAWAVADREPVADGQCIYCWHALPGPLTNVEQHEEWCAWRKLRQESCDMRAREYDRREALNETGFSGRRG